MVDMKKIFGARTSKKIALLLSASTLILPLAACNINNKKVQEDPPIEMKLCDTSDIKLDRFIDEYVSAYETGDITNGTEMYDYYANLYQTMSATNETSLTKTTDISDAEIVTYNFNGEAMNYEFEDDGSYYINGEIVKRIDYNNVFVKTIDGSIQIDSLDDSYSIVNTNDATETITTLQYNADGSYSVAEDEDSKYQLYEFNSDGILESSYQIDKENESDSKTIYNGGNINLYNEYEVYQNGELGDLIKEKHDDGSYIIHDRGGIDPERYDLHTNTGYVCDTITYYYNKNDELQYIETQGKTSTESHNNKFYPNGDYAEYNIFYEEDKSVKREEKIVNKYQQGVKNEIIKMKNEITGEFDTITRILDKNAKSPYVDEGTYIPIYEAINNRIIIQQKEGVTYNYDREGNFYEAYKVVEDGVIKYNEIGKKVGYIKDDGTKTYYNEDEKVKYVENNNFTVYYNDEESVSKIKSRSDDEIEVEVNNTIYKISQKDEYITFYDNGDEERIEKDGKIFEYDTNHNVTKVLENRDEQGQYEKSTSYYDYENNLVSYKMENNIGIRYFENQDIELVQNKNENECISVNDVYGDVYELNYGDEIKFRDNGNLEYLIQSGKRTVFYDKDDQTHYYVINKDNDCIEYYCNGKLMCEANKVLSMIGTGNAVDGITRRGIQMEDGTKLFYDEFENDIDGLER